MSAERVISAESAIPQFVVAVDLDDDGDLDVAANSTWQTGDWNGDGEFDSSDLVLAFQTGLYEHHTPPTTNQIAAAVDWLFARS